MTEISLTSSMRSNLQSLRLISQQMDRTQNRLSTGLKVNSAIDNASSYYQAHSLTNRAADLSALLDSMGQGIQTIQAANEGIEAGLAFLEQMKSVVEQAMMQLGDIKLGTDTRALYNGRGNTKAIIGELGDKAYAAIATNQFYVSGVDKNNEYFGQGKWYLPAIGELMDMYGTDVDAMTGVSGNSGAVGNNKTVINTTLEKLGGDRLSQALWSSSEYDSTQAWLCVFEAVGGRYNNGKIYSDCHVRAFQHLENVYNPSSGSEGPKVGDVMYDDLSYGSADGYEAAKAAGKTAVGVISWVSDDSKDVKIVNLTDLGDLSWEKVNSSSDIVTDITEISNSASLTDIRKKYESSGSHVEVSDSYQKQFNTAIAEYDSLIADTSYQGINLLKGGRLNVTLNETRSHRFEVLGQNITSNGLGLDEADWTNFRTVEATRNNIQKAIATLRDLSTDLGNNYQIIQTRQNFTDALINVLETGADNLTLADMNEESANYLALQTRQQLAINSLSLAASSARSILRLFY